jgi:hypothetical protein
MPAAEPADVALHAALLVGPCSPERQNELSNRQRERSATNLSDWTRRRPPQRLHDRGLQIVVADHIEDTAIPVERGDMRLENACWVSDWNAITNAAPEKQARI